ncbi:MAG: DNA-3-methyladenine glycosylase 2 family protein [Clostridiaceae bacterium]|nr:DNA-3-methyladenine glycosylase 2 family protein [Clostridiaceae bacterium]
MKLEIIYEKDQVVIKNMDSFEPKHIFECGQCFRWDREEDHSYTGIAYGRVLNVSKRGSDIIFKNTNKKDFQELWYHYFDLDTNYNVIKEKLSHNDPIMKKAIEFGAGIRILKQQPWETLISFIISSNNNIPRIKKAIELLCEGYGEYLGVFLGKKRYSFPSPETVAKRSIEEIKACNTGYRAPYIIKTAESVASNPEAFQKLYKFNTEDCQRQLLTFSGVGPKVAHCILFFCMGKMDAFPVDVWVKRIMEYLYFKEDTPSKVIQQFARDKYGGHAGFAQQYLFYYARELGIGKN